MTKYGTSPTGGRVQMLIQIADSVRFVSGYLQDSGLYHKGKSVL